MDDLWEHFTALKNTKYWKPENMGKAVQMSNEKQDTIISIWTNGTTFRDPSICDVTENVYLALSMARNYSFAAYAEKSGNLTDNMKKELDAFKLSCGAFGSEQVTKGKETTDTLQDSGWKDVIAAYYADESQLKADALGYLAIMEAADVIADGNPTAMDSNEFVNAMEPHLATVSGTLTKGKSALEAAMAVTGENAQILVAKNADGTVTCKVYPRDLDPRKDGSNGSSDGEAGDSTCEKEHCTSVTLQEGMTHFVFIKQGATSGSSNLTIDLCTIKEGCNICVINPDPDYPATVTNVTVTEGQEFVEASSTQIRALKPGKAVISFECAAGDVLTAETITLTVNIH